MSEALSTVGFFIILGILIFLGFIIHHTEFVLDTTFEKGLVEIDKNISYNCTPTNKTKKYLKLKKELERLEYENRKRKTPNL